MSLTSLPLAIREQIDAQCDEFERAWQAGKTPELEAFLAGVDARGQDALLCDLVAIELHYRRARGERLSDDALSRQHPSLGPRLGQALRRLKVATELQSPGELPARSRLIAAEADMPTADLDAKVAGSRGLHIRCPHCSSPVQLVTDTPFDSVTCSTCGSAFPLIDRDEGAEGPALLKLGRFELLSRLGMGGFGTVWKARDSELDRTVAIKVPRKGQLAALEIEQFFREARSAAQLRHRNIVQVHEVGRDGETIFIVSDFVRGVSLGDWLSDASPDFRSIAQTTATIADALHHAHEHGVIHRDLKPSNILMDEEDHPYLMDFGLAKRDAGEMTMTLDGQILGTASYMSPEQARGQSHWTDRRTDIYSLGVLLFFMLTGELPFRGNAQMQIQLRIREDAPDPRRLNRFIPRDLATICVKCLERQPQRRFPTAGVVQQELTRYLRGEPIHARPISRVQRAARWARRNPALATAAGLVVFLAIAGPLAALVIDSQRRHVEGLLSERTNLIKQLGEENTQNSNRLARLRQALDVWEGRANPWEFWPPRQGENLRRVLLSEGFEQRGSGLFTSLEQRRYSDEQLACGYLAMAMVSDELQRSAEARQQYAAAIPHLERLTTRQPQRWAPRRALADCYLQLARLAAGAEDRSEAQQLLEQARAIHEQLASKENDARWAASLLEVELRGAVLAGFESGSSQLERVTRLKEQLRLSLPDDPVELYQLVCFVAGREPMLISE